MAYAHLFSLRKMQAFIIINEIIKIAVLLYCRQPPLTVIRAILSGQTGTSPAINRYAAKGSLHE